MIEQVTDVFLSLENILWGFLFSRSYYPCTGNRPIHPIPEISLKSATSQLPSRHSPHFSEKRAKSTWRPAA